MTDKKKTKKELFNEILNVVTAQEHKDFIMREIEMLDKKSNSKKQIEQQKINETIKEEIMSVLSISDEPMSIPDMQAASDTLNGYANQKISALLIQLRKEEKVERVEVKGKAYFKAVMDIE